MLFIFSANLYVLTAFNSLDVGLHAFELYIVVVKLNWPRFYSLASTFSLTRLVLNRHYVDAA